MFRIIAKFTISSLLERAVGVMTGIFFYLLAHQSFKDLRIEKVSFKSSLHCRLNGLNTDLLGYELLYPLYNPFIVPLSLLLCTQLGLILLLLSTG